MEQPYSVIIIGAGIAGLACAKHLVENSVDDFVILEAEGQLGGRCQTIQLSTICTSERIPDDQTVELGAELLQGDRLTNPLCQLAHEHDLLEHSEGRVDRDDCYHDEDGESIDEDVINEIRTVYDEILEKKVPTYPYENYPDVSLGEFIRTEFEQYLQSKKSALDESEIAQREKVIDWLDKQHPFLDALGCQRLTDVSVQGWISFERLPANDEQYVQGGFARFLRTVLGERIPQDKIHFNSTVKRVSACEERQQVRLTVVRNKQETSTYVAKHIVCTQSLGCLKKTMHEMFVPPLPHAKRASIERLGFGTSDKIYLIFSQPFWDVDFHSFNLLWNSKSAPKLACLEKTPFDSWWCKNLAGFRVHHRLVNTLVSQISGEAARYMEGIPDDLLSECFQELLGRFYPDSEIPRPDRLVRSQWATKASTCGSHTFIQIGSTMHDIRRLASPWPNKPAEPLILFAGEGTHERFFGTAHGAFLTGIREGKRLLELSGVSVRENK